MSHKDVRQTEHSRLEALRKEGPQWVKQAQKALEGWRPGENFLITVVAQGLREAYEAGVRGAEYPETPKPTRRVRAAPSGKAKPTQEAPVARVRRTR